MNGVESFLYIFTIISAAAVLSLVSLCIVHFFQLESYRVGRLARRLTHEKLSYNFRLVALSILSFLSLFVCLMLFGDYKYIYFGAHLFFLGLNIHFFVLWLGQKKKTPLKITPRVVRLMCVVFLSYLALSFVSTYFLMGYKVRFLLLGILPFFAPFVVVASAIVVYPIERAINRKYFLMAKAKLAAHKGLKVIGITGSYGKTSVRAILAAFLATTFKTGSTINSFNTPMGIARLVNDQQHIMDYDFFIAEMGAKQKGDIDELCELVSPFCGIITGIGNQHLETFKTLENIAATKFELANNIKEGGFCAFNCLNERNLQLYESFTGEKIGVVEGEGNQGFYASFSNLVLSKEGASFDVYLDGNKLEITTPLLGKNAAANITLCAAVAYKLGVSLDAIKSAALKLKAQPHRLELIKNEGDMAIIDDAYNSNADGARAALEVVGLFEGKKIIITPGIVELGSDGGKVNFELGQELAAVCDYAFVLGVNADVITKGAISGGFCGERIKTVATLGEAVEKANQIEGKKVILFENDLPDNY